VFATVSHFHPNLVLAGKARANKTGAAHTSLYYKHITVMDDDSSIINKFGASLTDDAIIIYNRNMFTVQATGLNSQPSPQILD
jgi:hypothetical protein